jgi:hypothetical protein
MKQVPPPQREAVARWVDDVAHDVGRYVAIQSLNLADDDPPSQVVAYLQDDLVRTRSGPQGTFDLAQVWAPYAAELAEGRSCASLMGLDELRPFIEHIRTLIEALPRVREGDVALDEAWRLVAIARQVSAECRLLRRAVREVPRG